MTHLNVPWNGMMSYNYTTVCTWAEIMELITLFSYRYTDMIVTSETFGIFVNRCDGE